MFLFGPTGDCLICGELMSHMTLLEHKALTGFISLKHRNNSFSNVFNHTSAGLHWHQMVFQCLLCAISS